MIYNKKKLTNEVKLAAGLQTEEIISHVSWKLNEESIYQWIAYLMIIIKSSLSLQFITEILCLFQKFNIILVKPIIQLNLRLFFWISAF